MLQKEGEEEAESGTVTKTADGGFIKDGLTYRSASLVRLVRLSRLVTLCMLLVLARTKHMLHMRAGERLPVQVGHNTTTNVLKMCIAILHAAEDASLLVYFSLLT